MKKKMLKEIYETVVAYENIKKDALSKQQLVSLEKQKKELLKCIKKWWYR